MTDGPSEGRPLEEPTPIQIALIEELSLVADPPPLRGTQYLHLSFPSAFVHGDDATNVVIGRMVAWRWLTADQAEIFAHALHEAIVNAVVHGNRGRIDVMVDVELRADHLEWDLLITDHGKGFTHHEVLRAFRGRRHNLGHGRGIVIMAGSLDRLAYYHGGRTALLGGRRADAGVSQR
jgi:anti-sigma regulatory factor (Ser/Thr protein kinase)